MAINRLKSIKLSDFRRYKKLSKKTRMKKIRVNKGLASQIQSRDPVSDIVLHSYNVKTFSLKITLIDTFLEIYLGNPLVAVQDVNMLTCPHFSVSSSQLYKFLFKPFSLKNLHSFYFTGKNRAYGRIAEDYVKSVNRQIRPGFCLFSTKMPMICAAPDGIEGQLSSNWK